MPAWRRPQRQRGALLLELAICLPLMGLLTLATLDACAMLHVRQSLKIAAFEAAQVSVDPQSSLDPHDVATDILRARRIEAYATHISAGDGKRGGELTFCATAECAANSLMRGWFYRDEKISESVTLVVE